MARGFQFRLEVVRRVREQAQNTQRKVVADAIRALQKVEKRIEQLHQSLHRSICRSRDDRMNARVDVFSLRGHQMFQARIHRHLLDASRELMSRQAVLAAERVVLAEANKKLKAIEKLREKQWNRYKKDMQKKEQADYDEASVVLHARAHDRGQVEDEAA